MHSKLPENISPAVEPELTAEEFLEEKLEIARSELQCDSKCGHRDKSDLL